MPSPDRIAEILASERFLERLAEIEHERWAHWQRYVHENCERQADGSLVIPAELVDRWEAQIRTPYAQLSEREKEQNAADHRALPDIRDSIALLAHYRKALGL